MLDDQDEFNDFRRQVAEQAALHYEADVETLMKALREVGPEIALPRLWTREALMDWERQLTALLLKRYGIKRRSKDGQKNVS